MIGVPTKSTIFVVDDDSSFNQLMMQVLKKYGLKGECFTTVDSLLRVLNTELPDLFLIDLNIGISKSGFDLLQIIREKYTQSVPIFVLSSDSNLESISHALEIGANDYVFKPLDRDIFISKLQSYVNSAELQYHRPVNVGVSIDVFASFNTRLVQIDEMGLTITCSHLILKGTALTLKGEIIDTILGKPGQIMATAISSTVSRYEYKFKIYLEFDIDQGPISELVRTWIVQHKENKLGH